MTEKVEESESHIKKWFLRKIHAGQNKEQSSVITGSHKSKHLLEEKVHPKKNYYQRFLNSAA